MKIIKIPAKNAMGKTDGVELAPDLIVEAIKRQHLNEFGRKPYFSVEQIPINNSNIEQNNKNIYEYLLQNEDAPIMIGGDHSITYPCFKAFSKKFQNPGLLVFDAHPDLVNNFKPPTHEDYLRVLIEEKHVKPQNLVLVGIRSWDKKELDYLKGKRIKHFTMREITAEGKHDICDAIMSVARQFGALYISIDIDVVDPAFAPGTGYPEPGGLTSRELLYFLHRLQNLRNIKAYDLVEVNPKKDVNGLTVKLAGKIIGDLF